MMKSLIISLVCILLIPLRVWCGTPFVFVYEAQELFPYYMGNTNVEMENPGVSVEMIKHLETMVPVQVRFVRLPWKRALIALKAGKADGLIASFKETRKEFGRYPLKNGLPDREKRLDQSNYYLYVLKTSKIIWSPGKLHLSGVKKGVGAPAGYSIIALLKKTNVSIDEYGDARDNLIKLISGRLDGAALLEFDTDRILFHEKQLFKDVTKLDPALESKPYYLMISHQFYQKETDLSEKIWDACGQIRQNMRQTIMQRYLQMEK